jgi:hypothetical protein
MIGQRGDVDLIGGVMMRSTRADIHSHICSVATPCLKRRARCSWAMLPSPMPLQLRLGYGR